MKLKQALRNRSISLVVVAFGLVLLFFIWGSLYYKVQDERRQEVANCIKDTANYARAFAEHTARTIKGLDELTLFLKYKAEKEGLNVDISGLRSERRFEGQPIAIIGILNEAGELIASNQVPFTSAYGGDHEFFRVHRMTDTRSLFIGKPFLSQTSNKMSIQMSRRINKADGSFGGVVVIGIDPDYFAQFYKQVDLGERSTIVLIGLDGIVRVRQSGNSINVGMDFTGHEVMQALATSNAGVVIAPSPVDGLQRIRSYRTLPEYPLAVWVGVTEEEIFKDLNQRIRSYYWLCGAMSLVIAMFIAALLFGIERQKRAASTLREREARERFITNSTQDAVIMMAPTGTISFWNPAATKLFGYSETEALGKNLHQLLAPARYHERHRQAYEVFLQTGKGDAIGKTSEIEVVHKAGYEISAEMSLSAIQLHDGWHAVGIVRDITDRKRAEAVLQASLEHYKALMEQSFEALALVDMRTQEIVEVNRRFTELLGYSLPADAPLYLEQFVGFSRDDLKIICDLLTQQRRLPTETRLYRHKNGVEVPVERAVTMININGKGYLLGSLRDMTHERRKQAELDRDIELARRVQKELLPELPESPFVAVKTLYHPVNFVSGDSYHLEWYDGGRRLRGFLIDVSGHGLATAIQTSSISVLLKEAAAAKLPLIEQLRQINARAVKYFTDDAYAAMIGFELDLLQRELRYAGAGITQFYANGKKIETPGMFVGLWEDAEFCVGVLPVAVGDAFCFVTDGFLDALAQPEHRFVLTQNGKDFEEDVLNLHGLASSGKLRDDATGICIKVTGL